MAPPARFLDTSEPRSGSARSPWRSGSTWTRTTGWRRSPWAQQQRVEIIKALYRGADLLILDEPTAVLTPPEANELFEIIRDLAGRVGRSSSSRHKLDEVLALVDRFTVLRDARVVDTVPRATRRRSCWRGLMVGPRGRAAGRQGAVAGGQPVLESRG